MICVMIDSWLWVEYGGLSTCTIHTGGNEERIQLLA